MRGRRFLICCGLAAAAAGACGGRVSTGPRGTGGAGTGANGGGSGATGGTGGTASGGASYGGTGGTLPANGGSSYGGTGGGLFTCNPSDPNNSQCDTCLQTTCCVEWKVCETNAYCPTEFKCISDCLIAVIADAGTATQNDKVACADSCVDPSSGSGVIDVTTNDLFSCANDPTPEAGASCMLVCLGG